MAAKNKNGTKIRKVKEPENDSSDDEVDLETMEMMLEDGSDSEGDSEESEIPEQKNVRPEYSSESGDNVEEEPSSGDEMKEAEGEEESSADDNSYAVEEDLNSGLEGDETCNLDLGNLLAFNSHQVNSRSLYKKDDKEPEDITIKTGGMTMANEEYLLEKASEGCAQLLTGLWSLDTERTDVGPIAALPRFQTVTPRALPPPPPKAETRWEKFAKERGIAPKEKRSRKVWDEATGEWAYSTGYQKASNHNDPMSWPIMEVKKNDDPYEDPWMKARDAKKDRVDKNVLSRMKNAERSGEVDRGTTRRIMKAKSREREQGRSGGNLDMKNFQTPAGVPMEIAGNQRGKALTKAALSATQRSTASMGKFDQMREGEPERRKALIGLKKRKYESATTKDGVKSEAKKSIKILENVIAGGGKAKDKAIRRGDLARGESGHDYDFDDGLGASKYRKKKGRAGIGKMKKVTKKMAK